MEKQKSKKAFQMQPILCPWITSQPYHSSQQKKHTILNQTDQTLNQQFLTNSLNNKQTPISTPNNFQKSIPSLQQSSSQFFYFLRLMQLFPDAHPATLHTVLMLCNNDFYSAVDKMLYAKKCKLACENKNVTQKPQHKKAKIETVVVAPHLNSAGTKSTTLTQQFSNAEEGEREVIEKMVLVTSLTENTQDLSTFKNVMQNNINSLNFF